MLSASCSILLTLNLNGQTCPGYSSNITFWEGQPNNDFEEISICGPIGGGGQNDLDVYSITGSMSGATYQWQYSTVGAPYTWQPGPSGTYTNIPGLQWVIPSSFSSTPGDYYFRLMIYPTSCPTGFPSDIDHLKVDNTGNAPSPPATTGASSCSNPATLTLSASGCSGGSIRWYTSPVSGNYFATGTSYTHSFSATTTYYVSCASGSCESASRTPVTATIGTAPTPGTITGPIAVCAGQINVAYSIPSISGVNYTWTYSPAGGATITGGNSRSVTLSFSSTPQVGTLSVTTSAPGCSQSSPSNLTITVSIITAPAATVNQQPTCTIPTGTVTLSGLPAGNWTINPGNISGSGASKIITGLAPGSYNFTVTNAAGCTSESVNVVLYSPPAPSAPLVGLITAASSCAPGSTGAVTLNGLPPSGSWTINPGSHGGSGTTTNISGLLIGTYNFTVTISGCTSLPSADVVITGPNPPSAPTIGAITPPTCIVTTGSVVLNGLPSSGNWTINPGAYGGSGPNTTISGLSPGTYNFTVTNASGCTSVQSDNVVIISPTPPSAPSAGTIIQPTCPVPTGSVVLYGLPSGNWTLNPGNISGAGGTYNVSGLNPGSYNFTVKDEGTGCTSSSTNTVINAPTTPSAPFASATDPTCSAPTGEVTLSGLPTGDYTINPGGIAGFTSSLIISGLSPGTYSFTVTDAGGCTSGSSNSVIINNQPVTPAAPTTGLITQPTCTVLGSVVLNNLPSVPSVYDIVIYEISYGIFDIRSGTGPSFTVTGLPGGTYFFTVIGEICESSPSTNVVINTQPPLPGAPTASVTTQPTCAIPTGTITVSAPAPGAGITYTVTGTNPVTLPVTLPTTVFTGLAPGIYAVTVTNAGCTSPATSLTVNALPILPAPTASVTTQPTCAVPTGTITVSAPSPGAGISYTVTGTNPVVPAVTNATGVFTGLAPGIYSVTTTNGSCTSSAISLTINSTPGSPAAPTASVTTAPTCQVPTATITVSAPLGAYEYNIDGGPLWQSSNIFSGVSPGTAHTIIARRSTDITCVSGPTAVNVPDNPIPQAPIAAITQPTCSVSTGTVVLTGLLSSWDVTQYADAGLTIIINEWTGTSPSLSINLPTGTYYFTDYNANTYCESSATQVVIGTQPTKPSTPSPANNGPLCVGANLNLTTATVTGASYAWTGPNSYSSGLQNPTITAVALTDAGTYHVTVTVSGCTSDPGSTSVVVNPLPTTSAIYHQ